MIHYTISYTNPLTQVLTIELRIEDIKEEAVELQLAAWRPGRYELQNFAQNLVRFEVRGLWREKVKWEKITKDRWRILTGPSQGLVVRYEYYAHQMDAGGTWLDENQLYVNPITCLMAVVSRETEACELKLDIPKDWQIACGLPQTSPQTLEAKSYDELVDCPLIASPTLQHHQFEIKGIPFHLWFQGDCTPDWERMIQDFTRFTKEQLQLFGDFPVKDYHYLFNILPYKHYHGVEHSNSTMVVLGPGELLMDWSMYKELLGVSSHELFHTWNIKQIRPVEMLPYDYARENYFRTGFVAEGVTTYYGDYLLGRSGVFTTEQYFKELNVQFERYFGNNGRHNQPVSEASWDMWLDGYKPGVPNRKTSIYINGCLAAFILDLEIRKQTKDASSLDNLMKRMWEEFGKKQIGYTAADYQRIAEEVCGSSLERYFREVIFGTVPYEFYLQELLPYIGCELKIEPNPDELEGIFGLRLAVKGDKQLVAGIAPGSPAESTLMMDDEILSLNGAETFRLSYSDLPETLPLKIKRQGKIREVQLLTNDQPYYQEYSIAKRGDATEEQKASFKAWLNQEFDDLSGADSVSPR